MTPKEKCDRLFFDMASNQVWYKNDKSTDDQKLRAKKCVIVAVDEILKIGSLIHYIDHDPDWMEDICSVNYWSDVKKEIEKL
jgi:hypothetical protein